MTSREPTGGRDTAPAFWRAQGIAPGSLRTSLDRTLSRWDQHTMLRGVFREVTGYAGITDRMSSEQPSGCVGMRNAHLGLPPMRLMRGPFRVQRRISLADCRFMLPKPSSAA